ncbi:MULTISPECIES: BlaI/MecI/CopY family transcriptional regulator [Streptomyces]|uniref:BlaI/MecI/CopY family transcriptional regulator n=1 Tax=Streptomyces siderophoricus TaxID=2802281 RepID=A0ABS1MTR8_9ACTN|nr:BlaI/MecI/CopY family transcriptional regulator [Streptomyces sp. 9-7]MBL1091171.1 BlaI/MecI/CopY family transcriptional regulator [Streptomyces sp. 9-7]
MGGKPFGTAPGAAGRGHGRRRGQGQLESQVLAALQQAPGPVSAAWVQERLGGDLAYTTVMTILSRLHAKQAVSRERSGRAYAWTAAADEAGLAALRMRRVLDGEPDRDAVLTRFVSALPPHDAQLLRTLLDRATDDAPARDAATDAAAGQDAPPDGASSQDPAMDPRRSSTTV